MRPWLLLLVSLLVSDLSPLGDGDWVMENYSWSLYRKLLLNGRMTPRGPEILQSRAERRCMSIQRNCVCVAVQHKHRTSPFYCEFTVHDDHGCSLSHQEFAGIIHRTHIPALVISVLRGEGKRVLVRSGSPSVLHANLLLIKAGGETGHPAMDIIKDHPGSGSARLRHHHTAASGHNFPAFSLQKAATIVHVQKTLTKRCCAVTTVITSCCFKKGEIRSALKIKKTPKQQMARAQIRQKENGRRATGLQVLMERDGQRPPKASVRQRDISKAAGLHSGSSSTKTSDTSQVEIQRKGARIIKTNERLNWDEERLLQKRVERQRSLEDAYDDDDDDDGSDVPKRLLTASRAKTQSMNRPWDKMKAAQDGGEKDFSGKIIRKQAELRRPEGGSEAEQSQERSARIRRADFTHKADNNDVSHKHMLTEVREGILIVLFLSRQRKLLLNADTGWKTVIIPTKQRDNPPPMSNVRQEIFIFEAHNSKCTCLKGSPFSLEIYGSGRTEGMDLKPAESAAEVTTASAFTEQAETNSTPHESTSINQTKQEENTPSDQSVIPSPPSPQMMEAETTKADRTATENTEIKETTSSMEVFNHASTQTADGRSAEETPTTTESPRTEPTSTRRKANNNTAAEKSSSGLRMRDDVPAETAQLQEDSETEGRAPTNGPGSETREAQDGPEVNSVTSAKPSQEIRERAADELPKATDDSKPPCRGLIHRTDAGWKHCVDRLAGKTFPSREPTDPLQVEGEQEHKDEEYDHFYYFDGVLRRVRYNYRRQKKRHEKTESGVFTGDRRGDAGENLLSYIRRLALRNKHLK